MKGVAFEDQKLSSLSSLSLVLPSALSYDWLLPGVENGVENLAGVEPLLELRVSGIL